MIVRLGLDTDEDAYVDLVRLGVAESMSYLTFSEEVTRETYRRYLATAHPTIFMAEQGRRVVGFMHATISAYNFSDGIYTTQEIVFVHPDKRGSRAAALLLSHFTRWSDGLGAIENTGGNDNDLTSERTAHFLERFGFKRVGFFVRRMRGAQ